MEYTQMNLTLSLSEQCEECSGEGIIWNCEVRFGQRVSVDTKCEKCNGAGLLLADQGRELLAFLDKFRPQK